MLDFLQNNLTLDFSIASIAGPIAAILVGWLTVRSFFAQQRAARIQKAVFEESLVMILNSVDSALESADSCYYHIENIVNSSTYALKDPSGVAGFERAIKAARESITHTKVYRGYKKGMLIDLFEEEGYALDRWTEKVEINIRAYKDLVKTFFDSCEKKIQKRNENTSNKIESDCDILKQAIIPCYINKHLPLIRLFHKMILRITEYDFKNQKTILKKIQGDKELRKLRKDFTECYKILFGYYPAENKTVFYSYMHNKDTNKRYKINQENGAALISEEIWQAPKEDPTIIINDFLASKFSKDLYRYQLSEANKIAFEGQPELFSDQTEFFTN